MIENFVYSTLTLGFIKYFTKQYLEKLKTHNIRHVLLKILL